MASKTFTRTTSRTREYREGWGVHVLTVHAADSDDVAEIDVSVVRIADDTVTHLIGGAWCVALDGYYVPAENFEDVPDLTRDDAHDLRSRWFATEEEARAWAHHVESRWARPEPWCAFVVEA